MRRVTFYGKNAVAMCYLQAFGALFFGGIFFVGALIENDMSYLIITVPCIIYAIIKINKAKRINDHLLY